MLPKTKKAAKEAGYLTLSGAYSSHLVPLRNAEPIMVKGEAFYDRGQCEEIMSRTEAKRQRLGVPDEAKPVMTFHAQFRGQGSVSYDVYRISDCVPMRAVKEVPPVEIDLLQAVFTANKAAKRYRDSAQSNYRHGQHGFAGHAKETKETLYALKDKGIAAAYRQGRLSFVGTHGNMGLYRGDGYCFHSTLIPETCELVDNQQEAVFVEAAPKGTREGRLKDATHTLAALADDTAGFRRLSRPAIVREQEDRAYRPSEDYNDENEGEYEEEDFLYPHHRCA